MKEKEKREMGAKEMLIEIQIEAELDRSKAGSKLKMGWHKMKE